MRYSLSPERYSLREMATSSFSYGRARSLLSIVSCTCAYPCGFRACVPPKITSSIFPPRSVLEDCSPIAHLIASEILDFPEPFGPTIAVTSFSNVILVLSGKDLNPCNSSAFKYKGFTS